MKLNLVLLFLDVSNASVRFWVMSYNLKIFCLLGEKSVSTATSCSALKKSGNFKSGYYSIKPEGIIYFVFGI